MCLIFWWKWFSIYIWIKLFLQGYLSRLMTKWTKWLCAQRRLRSAWASAQSGQSLRCALSGWLRTQAFFVRMAKTDQTGWMPRLIWVFTGHTCHFVGFVVRRLICNCMAKKTAKREKVRGEIIWAAAWQTQQNDLCAQRRLRSAWASA